ncbi:MAG: hypothetical protein Q4F21_12375 [Lachnospiraceae bacterium]|nr:hypothetical protein [Lachnospiraceae bacterium]
MDTLQILEDLQKRAQEDEEFRKLLMETRKAEKPLEAFCCKCRELGYPLYEMDLVSAGEDFYASMRRSTNGGGENSPKLEGEDDFYEMFFCAIQKF